MIKTILAIFGGIFLCLILYLVGYNIWVSYSNYLDRKKDQEEQASWEEIK